MMRYRPLALTLLLGAGATATLAACETETPTMAIVENSYPEVPNGEASATRIVVYKAWWVATLFKEPVLPAAVSDEERSVPETDFVYALLAPGWDPTTGAVPTKLVAVKSKAKLGVARGETLHIAVSDETFDGNCDAQQPLSQEDAAIVTQRIFPGDFANVAYDPESCTTSPLSEDGGAGGSDNTAG